MPPQFFMNLPHSFYCGDILSVLGVFDTIQGNLNAKKSYFLAKNKYNKEREIILHYLVMEGQKYVCFCALQCLVEHI